MGRLQIQPQNNPLLSQSLEDLLLDAANFSDNDDEDDQNKTQLAKEESKLEKEIIRVILSGKTDSLKPNSGQAVTIGEHHICIGFHEEKGSDYRVWEWHGHIMLFDEENGYTPEYIYGNYFERLLGKSRDAGRVVEDEEKEEEKEEEEEEKVGNLGLRELIDGGNSGQGRILHRNMNAGSTRFMSKHSAVYLCLISLTIVLLISHCRTHFCLSFYEFGIPWSGFLWMFSILFCHDFGGSMVYRRVSSNLQSALMLYYGQRICTNYSILTIFFFFCF